MSTMQGDGELKDWLHETGKDIGKMVGTHLKKAAKDKAVSYAQEMIGEGLADELGMAAKSVAKKSAAHALKQAGSVTDAASAKAAAKSVGQAAAKECVSQLGNLASKYFGGAGTPAQAIRVCAYNVTVLRKIVAQFRRQLFSANPAEFLRMHAEIGLKSGVFKISAKDRTTRERLEIFLQSASSTARQGGYSAAKKREIVKRLKQKFHGKVPSKMTRDHLISYIYSVARDLNVDWEPMFESHAVSKRVRKGCRGKAGPGQDLYDGRPAQKRPPSAYNKFVRENMLSYQFPGGTTQKQKMGIIGKLWKTEKLSIMDEENARDIVAEDREEAAKRQKAIRSLSSKGKIPKKNADCDLDLDTDALASRPPGIKRAKIKKVGKKVRIAVDDESDDE